MCPHHCPHQILAQEQLRTDQYHRKCPVQDGRFPLDERFVFQQKRGAAEHHDDAETDQHHFFNLPMANPRPGGLYDSRYDRGRCCGIDSVQLEGDKEQQYREDIEQEFHGDYPEIASVAIDWPSSVGVAKF